MATPSKRVHFNRDISKFTQGSKTPTIERLSSTNPSTKEPVKRASLQQHQSNENNLITVGVRVRPLNNEELSLGYQSAVRLNESKKEIYVNDRTNKPLKFTCDF